VIQELSLDRYRTVVGDANAPAPLMISESSLAYYSGMIPGCVAGMYTEDQVGIRHFVLFAFFLCICSKRTHDLLTQDFMTFFWFISLSAACTCRLSVHCMAGGFSRLV
jgi:hypothetical protein